METLNLLPKKLAKCRELLDEIVSLEDARFFLKTLDPTEHGRTKEEYEKLVKQPMDFEAIRKKLDQAVGTPSKSGTMAKISPIRRNVFKLGGLQSGPISFQRSCP